MRRSNEPEVYVFKPRSRLLARLLPFIALVGAAVPVAVDLGDGLALGSALGMFVFTGGIYAGLAAVMVMYVGREVQLDRDGVAVRGITGDERRYPWSEIQGVVYGISRGGVCTMRFERGMQMIHISSLWPEFWEAAAHVERAAEARGIKQHWPAFGGRERWWSRAPEDLRPV